MHFEALPPLSLYIHFPWCVRKCPYCDFNSHAVREEVPELRYVDALLRDLDAELEGVASRAIPSVFIGGGTPSLMSPEAVQRLLDGVRSRLTLTPDVEITLESNPGTVAREHLIGYRAAGVNRLSIGVQSFRDHELEMLGRIHSERDAETAFRAARAAGFTNINIDLMFALPEDDRPGSRADVEKAIALQPEHISWYQLTIEPNTVFYQQTPTLPDDDVSWAMQQDGLRLLTQAGYQQYEVSAYARAGRRCVHNQNYWTFGDYLGIGAGAHGKVTRLAQQAIVRRAKCRFPNEYMNSAGGSAAVADEHSVGSGQVVVEFMMNALRLTEGFHPQIFTARTGLPLSVLADTLAEAEAQGLLVVSDTAICPTEIGHRYLNELIYLFLQDEAHFAVAT